MARLKIFEANKGRCHLCSRLIRAGETWDVSHDRPIGLLGEDGGDNLKVAHADCHDVQTREIDVPAIARAKRRKAKHLGIRSASKMPGSRGTKFKKHMDGRVTIR